MSYFEGEGTLKACDLYRPGDKSFAPSDIGPVDSLLKCFGSIGFVHTEELRCWAVSCRLRKGG